MGSAFSEERPPTAPLADPKQTVSLSLFVAEDVYMPQKDRELFLETLRRGLTKEGFTITSNGDIKIVGRITTYEPSNLFRQIFSIPGKKGYFNSFWVVLDKDDKQIFKGEFKGTFQYVLFEINDSMEQASQAVINMLVKAPQ